jgi:hypothetical protein
MYLPDTRMSGSPLFMDTTPKGGRPPRVGVYIEGGKDIHFHGTRFHNVDVPVLAKNSSNITLTGTSATFDQDYQRPSGEPKPSGGRRSSGWTPAIEPRPSLPVFCPKCNTIFPTRSQFASVTDLNVWENTEQCPNCDYPEARMSEGIFNVTRDAIEIIFAPDTTREMLEAFTLIAKRAVTGEYSKQTAVKEAERLSPKLAKLLKRGFKYGLANYLRVCARLSQQSILHS